MDIVAARAPSFCLPLVACERGGTHTTSAGVDARIESTSVRIVAVTTLPAALARAHTVCLVGSMADADPASDHAKTIGNATCLSDELQESEGAGESRARPAR